MSILMENATEKLASTLNQDGAPSGAPSIKRGRGRPKGSKNRPKDASGNPIDSGPTPNVGSDRPFTYIADPAGIAAAATAFKFIWNLVAPFAKVTELSQEESMKAGEALDPVLQKYIPIYTDWKYEINLALVIVGLYEVHRREYKKEHPDTGSEATIVEE